MNLFRRVRRTLGVGLALGLLIAGCSSGDGASTTTSASSTAAKAVPPDAATRTLDVGVIGLATLDPLANSGPATVIVDRFLYQPLVGLDPKTSKPTPLLARSWSSNAQHSEYTFHLDGRARFHDGTRVTAADVVATLARAKFSGASLAALLSGVGANSLVASKPDTLVVTLTGPDPQFPVKLSNPALGILPASLATGSAAALGSSAIGSGPYRVVSAGPKGIVLERARQHGPGRVAGVARVFLRGYANAAAAAKGFTDGEVDVTWVGNEEWDTVAARARTEGARPYLAVGYYGLNLKTPVFADARFRTAIVKAVDPGVIATAGYGRDATAAHGVVSTAVPGAKRDACAEACGPDVAGAKAQLAQAFPFGGVPTLQVDFDDTPAQQAMAAKLIAQLAAVGIPAQARPHPADQYPAVLAAGGVQIFRSGWASDAPIALSFLQPAFWPGAPENVTGVSTPQLTAALAAANAATTAAGQAAKAGEVEQALFAASAVIPVVQFDTRVAVAKNVQGVHVDAFGSFDPAPVTIGVGRGS